VIPFLPGTHVLDLSQYLPGPFATRMLGDLGADVVKVEPPAGDPLRHLDPEGKQGSSPFYELINAGKRVIVLDLKTPAGHEAFARLVRRADVLLESFRPGVLDRLGFGPDALQDLNPRLIHCALSGFGQTGPWRLVSGHDLGYVAMTGLLSGCGSAETPVMPFPPMADHAGAMQAVVAILGALIAREQSGKGCFLDVSMMESLLLWQAPAMTLPPRRAEGVINGGAAFYQIYRTADDRFASLSPLEAKFWANFCNAVGRPEWIRRQFEPMPQHALIGELATLFRSRPLADWDALLGSADCCYQAVLDYAEVADHPHIRERGLVARHGRITEVLCPVVVDGTPPSPRRPVLDASVEEVQVSWGAA
jgi:crotonobetainyl-CoA:carnitine CoA-transferase CaiB-like acyl-CoA transferase